MKKFNLNREFTDCFGTIIAGEKISDAVAKHLYLGKGLSNDNGDEKYAAYKLSTKIVTAKNDVEITPEEIALIKKMAAVCFTPGAYGQVLDLLDK